MTLKTAGFTLIELLVVIVILGIMAAITVPDFRTYQQREQLRSSVTEMQSFFGEAFAQARAQSQHQQVQLTDDRSLSFCSQPLDESIEPVCQDLTLPGEVTFAVEPSVAEWRYLAPHGDITDVGNDLTFTITHPQGAEKTIKLHILSGLVEEL